MSRSKVIINPEVIIDVAFEIISTRGLDSFSVRKLASLLNVSSMTLYNYVDNVEEIKRLVILRARESLCEDISIAVSSSNGSNGSLKHLFMTVGTAIYRFSRRNGDLYTLMFHSPGHCSFFEVEDFTRIPFDSLDRKAFYLLQTIIHGLLANEEIDDNNAGEAIFSSYLHLALDRLFPDL